MKQICEIEGWSVIDMEDAARPRIQVGYEADPCMAEIDAEKARGLLPIITRLANGGREVKPTTKVKTFTKYGIETDCVYKDLDEKIGFFLADPAHPRVLVGIYDSICYDPKTTLFHVARAVTYEETPAHVEP